MAVSEKRLAEVEVNEEDFRCEYFRSRRTSTSQRPHKETKGLREGFVGERLAVEGKRDVGPQSHASSRGRGQRNVGAEVGLGVQDPFPQERVAGVGNAHPVLLGQVLGSR